MRYLQISWLLYTIPMFYYNPNANPDPWKQIKRIYLNIYILQDHGMWQKSWKLSPRCWRTTRISRPCLSGSSKDQWRRQARSWKESLNGWKVSCWAGNNRIWTTSSQHMPGTVRRTCMSLVPPTVGSASSGLLSSTGRPLTSQSFLHKDRRRAWRKPPADFQHSSRSRLSSMQGS